MDVGPASDAVGSSSAVRKEEKGKHVQTGTVERLELDETTPVDCSRDQIADIPGLTNVRLSDVEDLVWENA